MSLRTYAYTGFFSTQSGQVPYSYGPTRLPPLRSSSHSGFINILQAVFELLLLLLLLFTPKAQV